MVDVLEFGCDVGGEVYPAAYAQRRPALTSNSMPPSQRSSSKKRHSHFDLFSDVCNATYKAVLFQVEQPIRQLLGVTFKLCRLV